MRPDKRKNGRTEYGERNHKKQRRHKHFRFVLVDCPLCRMPSVGFIAESFDFNRTHKHYTLPLRSHFCNEKRYQATNFGKQLKRSHILLPLSSIGRFRFCPHTHTISLSLHLFKHRFWHTFINPCVLVPGARASKRTLNDEKFSLSFQLEYRRHVWG